MTFRSLGLLAGALFALALASVANAQTLSSLATKDANSAGQNLCVYSNGTQLLPCHLLFGWTGSTPKAVSVDANGSMAVQDAGGSLTVDTGTPGQFAISSSALPTGASTSALQTTGNTSLATIATNTTGLATATTQSSILAAEASNVFFASYTTALGSSGTYTGTARDVGVAAGTGTPISYFNVVFYADQAGTAYIDLSDDGTTWTPAVSGTALAASTPLTLTAPLLARYYRPRLVNGTSAQTVLRVSSAFSRN